MYHLPPHKATPADPQPGQWRNPDYYEPENER
jgi:hypothetical protein